MTTATLTGTAASRVTVSGRTPRTRTRPGGRSLEVLAQNLVATVFGTAPDTWELSATRGIHDARRMRRRGDLDGALAVLEGLNVSDAGPDAARWAHAEWTDIVRRRFAGQEVLLYGQGTGRAAALKPVGDGRTLEVLAVLGMRWRPGMEVSRRSLRGLRPLKGGRR
ncbi:MAG: hypothetical protein F4169_05190 [Gammaproteobacteria bacterium]|nr:hypothetical protein [Chloroflexota bacterium]MYF28246.1 hypothetical protein [Gammaproteobacteria bacterium]MYK62457.1 hypothetical protein [Chloroflexota bacterium]